VSLGGIAAQFIFSAIAISGILRRLSHMPKKLPEVIEVSTQQFEKLLDLANSNTLSPEDTKLLGQLFESYTNLFEMVRDKNTTIGRLRKMLFGATTESSSNLFGSPDDAESEAPAAAPAEQDTTPPTSADNTPEAESNATSPDAKAPPPPGHGRHGADDYRGATQVQVPHATLTVGDSCPSCGDGKLYEKKPAVLLRFVGQAPIQGTVYRLQRLRCHLCNITFVADAPENVGEQKYDHSVAVMIGLLKYGSGMPFNRLERLQGSYEIPLAASTQWKLVQQAADGYALAYKELLRQAAQGDVVYHDDTKVRILELMGERAKKLSLSAEERLTYHQTHSKLAMDQLKDWLDRQITEKLVEPNSALGEAIQYRRNHWTPLTLFLRQAGAPLDNNICERALKKAILHRKNSMFYKSRQGSRVGDIRMSLIYTCELNNVNAFDYLNQLHLHAAEVADHPEQWMPWNYRDTMASLPDVELAVC
jgi:hypothetical protein